MEYIGILSENPTRTITICVGGSTHPPFIGNHVKRNKGESKELSRPFLTCSSSSSSSESYFARNALFTTSAVASAALLFSTQAFNRERRRVHAEVPGAHFSKPGVAVGQGMAEDAGIDGCTSGFKPLKPPPGKGALWPRNVLRFLKPRTLLCALQKHSQLP